MDDLLSVIKDLLLIILHALPVACAAWTLTHEEIFRDWWQFCSRVSNDHKGDYEAERHLGGSYRRMLWCWLVHKITFLFTCEYCVSHWLTLLLLLASGFRVRYEGHLGFFVAFFSVPWVAVMLMDMHQRMRVDIRLDRAKANKEESRDGKKMTV